MKKKIISRLFTTMLLLGIFVTFFEIYNFRIYGLNAAIDKAQSIAESVKNGLTSHMVNGNMHQRDVFLDSISNMKSIEQLWVIRGDAVNQQYGETTNKEKPKDAIDNRVLESGVMEYHLEEDLLSGQLRVTIPYNATDQGSINCLSCHDVKYNETLGAVSIVLDVSGAKQSGLNTIFTIVALSIIAVFVIIFLLSKTLNPYLDIIEVLSAGINRASNGVFEPVESYKNVSTEAKKLINEYNFMIEKLTATFNDIDTKLKVYIGNKVQKSENPLVEANEIVSSLSLIYQFKKEIELDNTKDEIYIRLAEILKNQFNFYNFSFIEIDETKNKSEVVFSEGSLFFCCDDIIDDSTICRASRNSNDVFSIEYQSACPCFMSEDFLYYCIDIEIGSTKKLIINFIVNTKQDLVRLKRDMNFIKSYVSEAAPVIEVKLLMQQLQESAFRDGLTGLYNRKFLDEHTKKIVPQALRDETKIGILMLDMDHFKAVNDEYGHDIGDKVLKELARILTENVRESDVVVRYGGEEFIVMLVGIKNEEDAMNIANKIRVKVSENEIDVYAGSKLQKTTSIGLSIFPDDSRTIDSVMKNADIALYEAKETGRNQVVRFDESKKSSIDLF